MRIRRLIVGVVARWPCPSGLLRLRPSRSSSTTTRRSESCRKASPSTRPGTSLSPWPRSGGSKRSPGRDPIHVRSGRAAGRGPRPAGPRGGRAGHVRRGLDARSGDAASIASRATERASGCPAPARSSSPTASPSTSARTLYVTDTIPGVVWRIRAVVPRGLWFSSPLLSRRRLGRLQPRSAPTGSRTATTPSPSGTQAHGSCRSRSGPTAARGPPRSSPTGRRSSVRMGWRTTRTATCGSR